MGNSNSSNKVSAQDKAILDMKIQRDKLQQYQKRITVVTEREREIAKECLLKGDKKRALLALRRKKYQESLLAKTDDQLAQLEILTNDVEFARVQKDVLYGLQQGTEVLKEIHREMGGIDRVEKLLEDTADAQAAQKEISDMLGGRMSNQDEDEVEDELEALEAEMNAQKFPETPRRNVEPVKRVRETPKERAERRRLEAEADEAEAIPA